jgi:hypothetical protein
MTEENSTVSVPRPRKRTRKALDRKQVLVKKLVSEGLSEARAHEEMRNNTRGDRRDG